MSISYKCCSTNKCLQLLSNIQSSINFAAIFMPYFVFQHLLKKLQLGGPSNVI